MNTPGDPLDIAILQNRGRHELRRCAFGTDDIYPIQHQHVEARIQIQHAAEALHKGHRAKTGIRIPVRPCLLPIPGPKQAEKYRQKCNEEPTIIGQAIADLYRQADNTKITSLYLQLTLALQTGLSAWQKEVARRVKPRMQRCVKPMLQL